MDATDTVDAFIPKVSGVGTIVAFAFPLFGLLSIAQAFWCNHATLDLDRHLGVTLRARAGT